MRIIRSTLLGSLTLITSTLPVVVYGQATIDDLLTNSIGFVETYLVNLAFAATFLFFIYGVARYILADADDAKASGRQLMIWGTLGIFVVSSIWGLIAVLNRTIGLPGEPEGTIRATCVPNYGTGGDCADVH